MRGTDRAIRQNQRTLERERNALDGNEKKLVRANKLYTEHYCYIIPAANFQQKRHVILSI